ncbi:alpha/beta fold hydrolase [Actinoplanes sp. LDG1-06]|uniref:Alpha/beta fold hydrolase n=1 Tax=Paractinoplanes ovalisporus TaxID=2810368 RepID=A0ABS2AI62_9ACTN|nr:alpha/beta fold hydrolase [Actinoplanes ovalisporus]MBM2619526.1 alpha/beta fold hydrolase [Actinoplanes ovalisporus]
MTGTLPTSPAEPVVLKCHRAPAEAGERVLFLHGLANSAGVWRTSIARWPEGAELWTADLPWRLSHPRTWSREDGLERYVAEAVARIPGGVDVIVAHSFAANLVLEALAAPDSTLARPRALVLVSPFYRATPDDFTWRDIERFPVTFRRIIEAGIAVQAGHRTGPAALDALVTRVCALVGPYGWASFLRIYLRTPQLALSRLGVPSLVVAGADDFCPPPAESLALAEAIPDARAHLVPGVGHFAMVQNTEAFVTGVSEFVADLRTSLSKENSR